MVLRQGCEAPRSGLPFTEVLGWLRHLLSDCRAMGSRHVCGFPLVSLSDLGSVHPVGMHVGAYYPPLGGFDFEQDRRSQPSVNLVNYVVCYGFRNAMPENDFSCG